MIKTSNQQWVIAGTLLLLTAIWLRLDYQQITEILVTKTVLPTLSVSNIFTAFILAIIFSIALYFIHIRWMPFLLQTRRLQLSLLSGLAFFCTLLISTAFIHIEAKQEIGEKRTAALTIATSHADSMLSLINQARSTTTALALLISNSLQQPSNVQKAASQLLATAPAVTNLQLAPNGIIEQIIPLKGNEKAIGHNLLADSRRNKEAALAKDTKQLTLAGPFQLIQGGVAVIARHPVFIDTDENNPRFWGFTSALMLLDNLIQQSRINTLEDNNYAWTLHRIHPDTGAIDIFARSTATLSGVPITHTIKVPNGSWVMSVTPLNGWVDINSAGVDGLLLMIITLVATLLIYNALRYPMTLAEELEIRTRHLNQGHLLLEQTQHQLKESQERLEMAVNGAELGLWDVNLQNGDATFNDRWAEMLGYKLSELSQSLEQWKALVHPDDLVAITRKLNNHIAGKTKNYQGDIRMLSKSGEWKWIQTAGRIFEYDRQGAAIRALGTHQDISERKLLELELKTLSLAIEHSPVATVVTTPEPKIIYVNPRFSEISGYSSDEVIGQNPRVLQSGTTSEETYHTLWQTITGKKVWSGELWNKKKNGDLSLESVSIAPVTNDQDEIINFVAVKQDITEQRQMEETIWHQANFDLLTDLCNRAHFIERAELAIQRATRHQQKVLILFIDLDQFKPVNDIYGHKAGDEVLKEFAKRLAKAIRSSDTAARIGGDEFTAVIEDIPTNQSIDSIIETIYAELVSTPIHIQPSETPDYFIELFLGASIGYSLYPDHGDDINTLLNHADSKMYQIKESRRSS